MATDIDDMRAALPNYDIAQEVGRGGWGVVMLGTHRDLNRRVAIKQLPRSSGADPVLADRFRAEARTVASLDHPHIVPVFDFVDRDGLFLLVMEYMSGGTLWDRFRTEGLSTDHSCALMLAAASALHYAHRHDVLHRDVKPENFLFSATDTIKLADFGIAKLVNAGQSSYTLAGQVVGTPAYMAPEQATGGDLSPATDVYSCGSMLYELLTGELPFPETGEVLSQLFMRVSRNPTPIADIRPDLPYGIGEVVMTALRTDPLSRFPTADAFGLALARAATRAFGSDWLLRSGVAVLGAPDFVAVTTHTADPPVVLPADRDKMRPSSTHTRLSQVLGGSPSPSIPFPPPPAPSPARITLDTPPPAQLLPLTPVDHQPGRASRGVLVGIGVLVVLVAIALAAVLLRPRPADVAAPPAPPSAPQTPVTSPPVTSPPVTTMPVTDKLTILSAIVGGAPDTFTVTWGGPNASTTHMLDVHEQTAAGIESRRLLLTSSPQTVAVTTGAAVCFVVTSDDTLGTGANKDKLTHSDPVCANGGTTSVLVPTNV